MGLLRDMWGEHSLSFSLLLLSYYDSDDDDDGDDDDECTNLSFFSAFCSFYIYTPHLPSPFSFLYYTLIVILILIILGMDAHSSV